ncbi:MAG: selenocysteine-specific translation elongation factor, partial [bacterium]
MQQVVIGTAGHIDHGKTALVKALTGIDTDTLLQEKNRGITIDLGFAYLNEKITIVDVPGHQKFIRNMVAGASTIHLGLLVVAADDGVMPQTLEHLHILDSLAIINGIIVITKIDTVDDEWIEMVIQDIEKIKKGTVLSSSKIIKVDSLTGKGINNLKENILSLANTVKLPVRSENFKLYVDRVFSKQGYGTIVTGTVKSGMISNGDVVELLPDKIQATIRGIQTHGGNTNSVSMGDRAALNLSKIELGVVRRGTILSEPKKITVTDTIVASIKISKHTNWKIKNNQRVRTHLGTREVLARLKFLHRNKENNYNCLIHFEKKVGVTIDELFLIRSYSPMETIANGKVLDLGKSIEKKLIKDYPLDLNERIIFLIKSCSNNPKSLEQWSKTFFLTDSVMLDMLGSNDSIKIDNDIVFLKDDLMYWKKTVLEYIKSLLNSFSLRGYIEMNKICHKYNFSSKWAHYIVKSLVADGVLILNNGKVELVGQSNSLNKKSKEHIRIIKKIINDSQNEIIPIKDLHKKSSLNPKIINELVFFINKRQEVHLINGDLIISSKSFNNLIHSLNDHFVNNETLSVSEFKNITGLTRKNAIPILEYLD